MTDKLKVAACGDSVMWGQGLLPTETFVSIVSERLAAVRGADLEFVLPSGVNSSLMRGSARSGAKIKAPKKAAADFVNTFPALFDKTTGPEFVEGAERNRALKLFGEHGAAFPTVLDQVNDYRGRADDVELLFLNGGANDVEFVKILKPGGESMGRLTMRLERTFVGSMTALFRAARIAFPSAVIVVPGYYPPLSTETDQEAAWNMFEHLSNKPDYMLRFNRWVQPIPGVSDFLNAWGKTHEPKSTVDSARRRTATAVALAHHFARKAIASLPARVVRPGVVFAHPSFEPKHSLFAPNSLLHEGYRRGSGYANSVRDAMLEERKRRTPRRELRDAYRALAEALTRYLAYVDVFASDYPDPQRLRSAQGLLATIAAHFAVLAARQSLRHDLPASLMAALSKVLPYPTSASDVGRAASEVVAEIGRINEVEIASLIHPNSGGARRYADRIELSLRRFEGLSIRDAMSSFSRPHRGYLGPIRTRQGLEAIGFPIERGLKRLRRYAFIESIGVTLNGLMPGLHEITVDFGANLRFKHNAVTWTVQSPYDSVTFAFDVDLGLGHLRRLLLRIRTTSLSIGDPFEKEVRDLWDTMGDVQPRVKFTDFTIYLNGHRTFARPASEGRDHDGGLLFWQAGGEKAWMW